MEKAQVSNSDDLQGVGLDFLGAKKITLYKYFFQFFLEIHGWFKHIQLNY